MRVQVIVSCDAMVDGVKRALWAGQFYDLPYDAAKALVARGAAEPEVKAKKGPPEDK